MIAVLTGDIVHSQTSTPEEWLPGLKEALRLWGDAPQDWEIYRGDSFQLQLSQPGQAFTAALHLKATVKSKPPLDMRIAIGLGEASYRSGKITESNGPAFVYSGQLFETLKKEGRSLAIASGQEDWDEAMNLYFMLASITIDRWSQNSAAMVQTLLEEPQLSQAEMGQRWGISQSSVSERYSRSHFAEMMQLDAYFRKMVNPKTQAS